MRNHDIAKRSAAVVASTILAAAILVACGHGSRNSGIVPPPIGAGSTTAVPAGERKLDERAAESIVDPSLDPAERDHVRRALIGLSVPVIGDRAIALSPDRFQVAIINGKTGQIHYNRRDLRGTLRKTSNYWMQPSPQRRGRTPSLSRALESHLPRGTAYMNSGPYRQMYTNANHDGSGNAVASISANVSTTCNAGNLWNAYLNSLPNGYNDQRHEAGHSYLGGWSATDSPVDAGLIYNKGLQPASQDDYSPFMAIAPIDGYSGEEFDGANNKVQWHVPCSNYGARLGFYVNTVYAGGQPSGLQLITTVLYYDPSVAQNRFIVLLYEAATWPSWQGWSSACDQCTLKRMTSIAQRKKTAGGNADTFDNGDQYIATWSNTQVTCGFTSAGCPSSPNAQLVYYPLQNYMIQACDEYPTWIVPYEESHRDCINTPSGTVNKISVSNYGPGGEVDLINLSPAVVVLPSPSAPPGNTRVDQVLTVDPLYSSQSDGEHLGLNISNNNAHGAGTVPVVSYKFPNSATFEYRVFDAAGTMIWGSQAGQRYLQTLTWLTWQPNQTIHDSVIWRNGVPGQTYYFTASINACCGSGYITNKIPFAVLTATRSSEIELPGTTPVYSTPPPAAALPCTLDPYGYCAIEAIANGNMVCTTPDGMMGVAMQLGPNYWDVYSANGFRARYVETQSYPDADCYSTSTWGPAEPATVYNDPYLP